MAFAYGQYLCGNITSHLRYFELNTQRKFNELNVLFR